MLERLLSDVDPEVARSLDAALDGRELGTAEAARLLRAQGADFAALPRFADDEGFARARPLPAQEAA